MEEVSILGAMDVQKGDDFGDLVAYVQDRTTLEERLAKMEEFRGSIKDVIFRRVQRDYNSRLAALKEGFRPRMIEIVKSLKNLQIDATQIEREGEQVDDLLAELRFRNEVGEFRESEFREKEDEFLIRQENFAIKRDDIRHTTADYMFYLHDDEDFRQIAAAENILDRLLEDYRQERSRTAERQKAQWQPRGGSGPGEERQVLAELVEDPGETAYVPSSSPLMLDSAPSGPTPEPRALMAPKEAGLPKAPPSPKSPRRPRRPGSRPRKPAVKKTPPRQAGSGQTEMLAPIPKQEKGSSSARRSAFRRP